MSARAGVARPWVAVRARRGGVPLGAILGAVAALAAAAVALLPLDRLPWTVCYFKAITGWPCLSCGSTRALTRLLALDLPGALAMNPLATLGLLALAPWAAADAALLAVGRSLSVELGRSVGRAARVALLAALAANWLYLVAAGR